MNSFRNKKNRRNSTYNITAKLALKHGCVWPTGECKLNAIDNMSRDIINHLAQIMSCM